MTAERRGPHPAGAALFVVFALVGVLVLLVLFGISPRGLLAGLV